MEKSAADPIVPACRPLFRFPRGHRAGRIPPSFVWNFSASCGIPDRFTAVIKANINLFLAQAEGPARMIDHYIHFYSHERILVKTGEAPLARRLSCQALNISYQGSFLYCPHNLGQFTVHSIPERFSFSICSAKWRFCGMAQASSASWWRGRVGTCRRRNTPDRRKKP